VLQATLRAESDEALQVLADHVAARAAGLGKTYELAVEHEWVEPFPATRNDPDAAARCRAAAQGAGLKLVEQREPQPWSEDFGHFLAKWPGALVLLGSGDAPALHTPGYDFPDDALAVGIRFLVALAEAP
jgi:metal-dependent amidase/aminoacylase/carboxypeptidase family protein